MNLCVWSLYKKPDNQPIHDSLIPKEGDATIGRQKDLDTTPTSKATTTAAGTPAKGGTTARTIVLDVVHGGALGSRLFVRIGHNFRGQGQVGAQILNALVRQVAVIVLPVEGDFDKAARFEGFHEHEHFQVGGALDWRRRKHKIIMLDHFSRYVHKQQNQARTVYKISINKSGSSTKHRASKQVCKQLTGRVRRRTRVLLDDEDTFLEQVGKGGHTVFLGNEHG